MLLLVVFLINGCSSSKDPVTGETQTYEPDPRKRAKEYADKGGGIFGDLNNKNQEPIFMTSRHQMCFGEPL